MSKIDHIHIREISNGFILTVCRKGNQQNPIVHFLGNVFKKDQQEPGEEWKDVLPKGVTSNHDDEPQTEIHFPDSFTMCAWITQTFPSKD